MTKRDEINLLDAMIAKFGTSSYLGPWLADNRCSIVADITNDVTPDVVMPSQARREAFQLIEAAKAEAVQVRAEAKRRTDEETAKAYARVAEIRSFARSAIERAVSQL